MKKALLCVEPFFVCIKRESSLMKNKTVFSFGLAFGIAGFFGWCMYPWFDRYQTPLTQAEQKKLTPDVVLQDLIEGNKRFVSHASTRSESLLFMSRKASEQGQFPKAVVLACMDSRSVPEMVFDQSIADIFTLRIAGNIVSDEVLASMEYGTKHAGAKLIVVMGHTQCGAVKAACQAVDKEGLKPLIDTIEPAVAMVKKQKNINDIDCNDAATTEAITIQNVRNMKVRVLEGNPVVKQLIANGDIKIVGALHNIATGVVAFLD